MKIGVMVYVSEHHLKIKKIEKELNEASENYLKYKNLEGTLASFFMRENGEWEALGDKLEKNFKFWCEVDKNFNTYYNNFWGSGLKLLYWEMRKEIEDWGKRNMEEFRHSLKMRIPLCDK